MFFINKSIFILLLAIGLFGQACSSKKSDRNSTDGGGETIVPSTDQPSKKDALTIRFIEAGLDQKNASEAAAYAIDKNLSEADVSNLLSAAKDISGKDPLGKGGAQKAFVSSLTGLSGSPDDLSAAISSLPQISSGKANSEDLSFLFNSVKIFSSAKSQQALLSEAGVRGESDAMSKKMVVFIKALTPLSQKIRNGDIIVYAHSPEVSAAIDGIISAKLFGLRLLADADYSSVAGFLTALADLENSSNISVSDISAVASKTILDSPTETGAAACGASPDGTVESRTRFQAATASYGDSCHSELQERICRNGSWSTWTGSYAESACSVNPPQNCGSLAHGGVESRDRYQTASVPFGSSCSVETQSRSCFNGSFSSWSPLNYTETSCTAQAPADCGATPHGENETRVMYLAASVAFGNSCVQEIQTRSCYNSVFSAWSGAYTAASCSVEAPASCEGTPHGESVSRTMYAASSVPFGEVCLSESQSRSCNNGTFSAYSGSYSASSCVVEHPANCGGVAHGDSESRTMYQYDSVAYNQSCGSEMQTRTCNNGVLSSFSPSNYTFSTCAVLPEPDTDGDGIKDSQDVCPGEPDSGRKPRYLDGDGDGLYVAAPNVCPLTDGYSDFASAPVVLDNDDSSYQTAWNFSITSESVVDIDFDNSGTKTTNNNVVRIHNPRQYLDFARNCRGDGSALSACSYHIILMHDLDFASIDGSTASGSVDAGEANDGVFTITDPSYIIAGNSGGSSYTYLHAGGFEGQNHVIKNLVINIPTAKAVALLGSTQGTSTNHRRIANLSVQNVKVTGLQEVGVLVGFGRYISVSNITIDSTSRVTQIGTTGSIGRAGSIAGVLFNSSLQYLANYASVECQWCDDVGGIVGSFMGSMDTVKNHGGVNAIAQTQARAYRVGGVVGSWHVQDSQTGDGKKVLNTGAVYGRAYVGGIAGHIICSGSRAKTLSMMANTGLVALSYSGGDTMGGLFGQFGATSPTCAFTIADSYNAGTVSGGSGASGFGGISSGHGASNTTYARVYNTGNILKGGSSANTQALCGNTGAGGSTVASGIHWLTGTAQQSGLCFAGMSKPDGDSASVFGDENWLQSEGYDFTNTWIMQSGFGTGPASRPTLRGLGE